MGFVRRIVPMGFATTGIVEISEEVWKDIETSYLQLIISIIENNQNTKVNSDKSTPKPSKYVPSCIKRLEPKGIKIVSVAGSTDNKTITTTFTITMDGKFLPSKKTSKSIPPVTFPDGFLVSANKNHYSNEKDSLKMLEYIIIPYAKKQRQNLNLDPQYPALLILDVFKGQMTKQVKELLYKNTIGL